MDTQVALASIAQLLTWPVVMPFAPDGTIDVAELSWLAHMYAGFAAVGACPTFGWAGGTGGITGGGTCAPGSGWAGT